jgi:hypothetical protein
LAGRGVDVKVWVLVLVIETADGVYAEEVEVKAEVDDGGIEVCGWKSR